MRAQTLTTQPQVGLYTGSLSATRYIQQGVNSCMPPNDRRLDPWVEVVTDGNICVLTAHLGGEGVTSLARRCFEGYMVEHVYGCRSDFATPPALPHFRIVFHLDPCRPEH